MPKYKIFSFTIENFAEALCLENKYTHPFEVAAKPQFKYLFEYLSSVDLNAKTIIVEFEYISKDYLVDFATYFVTCFDQYSKHCIRLHFFNVVLNANDFEERIIAKAEKFKDFCKKAYLGYIVGKPLPIRVIGKTVLKSYNPYDIDGNFRNYFGTRSYSINIFGNEVELESLGFMEQDSVVSVCATSAIWMMLQKASIKNYAVSKTPSQITDEADIVGTHGERVFPNKGLSVKQISQSIFKSGLVCEIRTIAKDHDLSKTYLKKCIYAFAPIGIPLILVLNVPFKISDKVDFGHHAVTVVGYKIKSDNIQSKSINFISDSIYEIYTHDDAWGPYARFEFEAGINGENRFITKWSNEFDPKQPTHLTNIIFPLYHKIRINIEDVEQIVVGVNTLLRMCTNLDFSWDITLQYSEKFKEGSKKYDSNLAKKIHLSPMPKYIWVAKCIIANKSIFEIIFDATDIAIGMFGFAIYFHNESIRKKLYEFIAKDISKSAKVFSHACKLQFAQFIIDQSKIDYYAKLKS